MYKSAFHTRNQKDCCVCMRVWFWPLFGYIRPHRTARDIPNIRTILINPCHGLYVPCFWREKWVILGKLQNFTILTLQLMYHQLQKDKSHFFLLHYWSFTNSICKLFWWVLLCSIRKVSHRRIRYLGFKSYLYQKLIDVLVWW